MKPLASLMWVGGRCLLPPHGSQQPPHWRHRSFAEAQSFFLRHDWKTENGARSPSAAWHFLKKHREGRKGEADTERWVTEAVTLWRHRVGVGPASASPAVSWELAHWSDTRTTSDDLDDRTIPGDRIEMWEAKDSIKNECCQLLLVTINESHKKPRLPFLVFSFLKPHHN